MKKIKNEEKKIEEQQEQLEDEGPMSNEKMINLLYELSKTYTWEAIKRYNMLKDVEVINTLASVDMFKNPTQAARSQGIRIGIYYIEQIVKQETERRARLQEELNSKSIQ